MSNAKARHRRRYRRRATFHRKWDREGGIMGFFELMYPDDVRCELRDISNRELPAAMALGQALVSKRLDGQAIERIARVLSET